MLPRALAAPRRARTTSPTTTTPGPRTQTDPAPCIDAALSKLQDARGLDERERLDVEKWTAHSPEVNYLTG